MGKKQGVKIVGLGGSLGTHSSTSLTALDVALRGAQSAGAHTELLDVAELGLPMFVPKTEHPSPEVIRFIENIRDCDGMIWSSPLYHGTISGLFKNALDWLDLLQDHDPPFLSGKVVGMVCTAGGVQGLQAINTMEFVARALRAWGAPITVPVANSWEAFDKEGVLVSDPVQAQLETLGRFVADSARRWTENA